MLCYLTKGAARIKADQKMMAIGKENGNTHVGLGLHHGAHNHRHNLIVDTTRSVQMRYVGFVVGLCLTSTLEAESLRRPCSSTRFSIA